MKIGYYSNNKADWDKVFNTSIINSGNQPSLIRNINDVGNCKILFLFGVNYSRTIANLNFFKVAKRLKIPIIFFDAGIHHNFKTVCINEPKRIGSAFAYDLEDFGSRSNNFIKYMNYKPWNQTGENVCVMIHNIRGYKSITQDINKQLSYINEVINKLKKMGYNIIINNHPGSIDRNNTIHLLRKNILLSKFCVGWHTNALCHSITMGVPAVCLDEDSFAYDVSSKSLDEKLIYPDRSEWINMLSWTQWTKEEIMEGKLWKIIFPHLNI